MAKSITALRGTQDVLPRQSRQWQYVEHTLLETARLAGFQELRVPVFESTELFTHSVGDTTDVVQKEMYTFEDKGGRSITLRPEGTAGAVRSLIEHGLYNDPLPVKACYVLSCYRYEKPQAGRLREFHQFGVECFGAASPAADAEVISIGAQGLAALGISGIRLEINSIGCPECRSKYTQALKEYFRARQDELCETCRGRLERNPMRILDCKSPVCSAIAAGAPHMLDYLCGECADHFDALQKHLTAMGIAYEINPTIVRGLDYYTRTVFEFVTDELGAQAAVCAGGRYDGLVEYMGGPSMPSLGFGMGLERVIALMDKQGCALPPEKPCELYIAPLDSASSVEANRLCMALRAEGFGAQTDLAGRGLKAQMKYADKLGAKFTLVLGEEERSSGKAVLKNMTTGERQEIAIANLIEEIYNHSIEVAMDDLTASIEENFSLGKGEQRQ